MKPGSSKNDKKDELICWCNEISRSTIEAAILDGCDTLGKIFDRTTAGVGPCGGSCRKYLGPMLDYYLQHGKFPDGPIRPCATKKNRSCK
ncbi:MAG: (2Fe-2S)-binding protein [Bdellovibrionales bacterium]|jgi:NAD(P)H-nitrite reductase large subunit|nr:(2Fe-2S)-binding protein [Bdellovibrionales bacterium]